MNECFVKLLRDPNRPWGKDNFWALNPNSEYTFADGVFRRRRKRLSPGLRLTSTSSNEDFYQDTNSCDEDKSESKPQISPKENTSFTIENILKKDVKPNLRPIATFAPLLSLQHHQELLKSISFAQSQQQQKELLIQFSQAQMLPWMNFRF